MVVKTKARSVIIIKTYRISCNRVSLPAAIFLTLRLVKEGELGIDCSAREGGQAQQVFLQQGDVGLLVHSRHVLCEGDEEENSTDFFEFTRKHLKTDKRKQNLGL